MFLLKLFFNNSELNDFLEDSDDLWDQISALSMSINSINELKQRLAILENELKYVNRDHNKMLMNDDGM